MPELKDGNRNRSQRVVLLCCVSACAGSQLLTTPTEDFGQREELIDKHKSI